MASKKRGRLRPEDDFKIRKNYSYLKENFDPADGVLDLIVTSLVFTLHDRDFVINGGVQTATERCERFLTTLCNSGVDAYPKFIEALKEAEYEHIADTLENTDTSSVMIGAAGHILSVPQQWIDELPADIKTRRLDERDCSRLSSCIGEGFLRLMIELKFSKVKVEQEMMSHNNHPTNTIASLLIKWKQREVSNAQWFPLLDAMRNAEKGCSIDWDGVQKLVTDL